RLNHRLRQRLTRLAELVTELAGGVLLHPGEVALQVVGVVVLGDDAAEIAGRAGGVVDGGQLGAAAVGLEVEHDSGGRGGHHEDAGREGGDHRGQARVATVLVTTVLVTAPGVGVTAVRVTAPGGGGLRG